MRKKCSPVPSCIWLASFHDSPKRSHKDKPHITMLLTIRKRAAACKIQQLCGMSQALKRNIWLLEVSTLQILRWVLSSVFSLTVWENVMQSISTPKFFQQTTQKQKVIMVGSCLQNVLSEQKAFERLHGSTVTLVCQWQNRNCSKWPIWDNVNNCKKLALRW